MRCVNCVLRQKFGLVVWCLLDPADQAHAGYREADDAALAAWLARDCVRDPERRAKLKSQLERG